MKAVLKKLGFQPRPQKATSHEQWVRGEGSDFRRVTVDCPKAPFTDGLLSMMLHQAGLTKKEFYKVLDSI
ncbi:type II toxin-antitoxin system HicA family toxin [Lysobacter maris]